VDRPLSSYIASLRRTINGTTIRATTSWQIALLFVREPDRRPPFFQRQGAHRHGRWTYNLKDCSARRGGHVDPSPHDLASEPGKVVRNSLGLRTLVLKRDGTPIGSGVVDSREVARKLVFNGRPESDDLTSAPSTRFQASDAGSSESHTLFVEFFRSLHARTCDCGCLRRGSSSGGSGFAHSALRSLRMIRRVVQGRPGLSGAGHGTGCGHLAALARVWAETTPARALDFVSPFPPRGTRPARPPHIGHALDQLPRTPIMRFELRFARAHRYSRRSGIQRCGTHSVLSRKSKDPPRFQAGHHADAHPGSGPLLTVPTSSPWPRRHSCFFHHRRTEMQRQRPGLGRAHAKDYVEHHYHKPLRRFCRNLMSLRRQTSQLRLRLAKPPRRSPSKSMAPW